MDRKQEARRRRHVHIRKAVRGTPERPRLAVFRSARHIYAQIIDDVAGATLAAASTLDGEAGAGSKVDKAKRVGELVGKRAQEQGIGSVVFDRGGYLYHGRVAALADGAREAGLKF